LLSAARARWQAAICSCAGAVASVEALGVEAVVLEVVGVLAAVLELLLELVVELLLPQPPISAPHASRLASQGSRLEVMGPLLV
jgi:hypothetical protein